MDGLTDGKTPPKVNKITLLYCFISDILSCIITNRKVVCLVASERSTLVIKMDRELHKQIKANCAINEISIRDYVIGLVKEDFKRQDEKARANNGTKEN